MTAFKPSFLQSRARPQELSKQLEQQTMPWICRRYSGHRTFARVIIRDRQGDSLAERLSEDNGMIVSVPILGGLHHRYHRDPALVGLSCL